MKNKKTIRWLSRYSDTMENDKHNRWARIAYCGFFNDFGFLEEKVCRWKIAWIKKTHIKGELYFKIYYEFPNNGKVIFKELEGAKSEVENCFDWFIHCINKENK